jgi:hypothetical protein
MEGIQFVVNETGKKVAVLIDLPTDNSEQWRIKFEIIAVTFDVLGALVREDMVYKPIAFKIYWDAIIKVWHYVRSHEGDMRRMA